MLSLSSSLSLAQLLLSVLTLAGWLTAICGSLLCHDMSSTCLNTNCVVLGGVPWYWLAVLVYANGCLLQWVVNHGMIVCCEAGVYSIHGGFE